MNRKYIYHMNIRKMVYIAYIEAFSVYRPYHINIEQNCIYIAKFAIFVTNSST